jgi:hypothetical protein
VSADPEETAGSQALFSFPARSLVKHGSTAVHKKAPPLRRDVGDDQHGEVLIGERVYRVPLIELA